MQKDKLVIFDWGGIVESHDSEEYNYMKATLDCFKSLNVKISDEEIWQYYMDCLRYMKDKTKEELFSNIKEKFNLTCDIDEFEEQYNKYLLKVDYYSDVAAFIHSLKGKCKIGILSNLNPFDKIRIDKQMDLSKFDYIWLSFELKCEKPIEEIYNIVEKDVQVDNTNILFVDDTVRNLDIPKRKGWQVCCANGKQLGKIKRQVEEFLKQ